MADRLLSYTQLSSSVNPSFWSKFTDLKLNIDRLNETTHHVWGYFQILQNKNLSFPLLEVDSTSFNTNFSSQNLYLPFHGKIVNKNTIEQFKECDKMELINSEGRELWEKIRSSNVLQNPSLLNFFIILSFSDLKKYHYYYWFAFPVPKDLKIETNKCCPILEEFTNEMLNHLLDGFKKLEDTQKPYFIVQKNEDGYLNIFSIASMVNKITSGSYYFVFVNISCNYMLIGAQLRNYVTAILNYCPYLKGKNQNFIALNLVRNGSEINFTESVIYNLKLPDNIEDCLNLWVGWEKNERDKMGPRLANMKNTLDPEVLAENSVDLNLKLMKWRIMPEINLEMIKSVKCLILGSGTLGCSVGRNLLAWGVRRITFVDNSTVSFSNPVRQSLFTYQDSVDMKFKAVAAADNLRKIFPGVKTKGVNLNIPMPGHSIGESLLEQTIENVNELIELIKEHDIIFLLMDSRESRWLPTILAQYYNKLVINAALGFDTYLVMRHGSKVQDAFENVLPLDHPEGYKIINGNNLGCYFCNDVTAPGDSTTDRTLDQQCTVTRPGVSQIAGALAVELAVSLLQHKDGANAPAFYATSQNFQRLDSENENQCVLGLVPHSIRGFLSSFDQILPATMKYIHCVACSQMVLKEYEEKGLEFLIKTFNSSKYLEDVTHLTEMFKETDFGDVLEFSDEDFDD